MKYDELNEDQKHQAKQDYLMHLADHGCFIRTIYGKEGGKERDPSYGELSEADKLVSDDTMRQEGVDYVPEDFDSPKETKADKILKWAVTNITMNKFREANPCFHMDGIAFVSVCKALDWARDEVAKYCARL